MVITSGPPAPANGPTTDQSLGRTTRAMHYVHQGEDEAAPRQEDEVSHPRRGILKLAEDRDDIEPAGRRPLVLLNARRGTSSAISSAMMQPVRKVMSESSHPGHSIYTASAHQPSTSAFIPWPSGLKTDFRPSVLSLPSPLLAMYVATAALFRTGSSGVNRCAYLPVADPAGNACLLDHEHSLRQPVVGFLSDL